MSFEMLKLINEQRERIDALEAKVAMLTQLVDSRLLESQPKRGRPPKDKD